MRGMAEPYGLEALVEVAGRAAKKIAPERQVFQNAQCRLQRIAMAEIVGLFRERQLRLAPFQVDRPVGRDQQARNQAQQRGLAGAVRADHGQNLAGRGLEIEAGEHLPAAPDTVDVASREPHLSPSQPSEINGYRVRICGYRIAAARLSVWRRF